MSDTTQLFNNGWPFEITPATDAQASMTNSFDDLMRAPDTAGSGWGDASKWAAGLKELGSGLKGGGGLPSPGTPQRNPLPSAAGLHQGTAGSLGTLLQLLAQRALMYNQAAHQGAVPARVQGSQGLLGL